MSQIIRSKSSSSLSLSELEIEDSLQSFSISLSTYCVSRLSYLYKDNNAFLYEADWFVKDIFSITFFKRITVYLKRLSHDFVFRTTIMKYSEEFT